MSLRDEFVQIMNDEGAASEGGWHSWRCFDKGRYPEPCQCTGTVAEMLVAAALDAAEKAVADIDGEEMCCACNDDYRMTIAAIHALKEK